MDWMTGEDYVLAYGREHGYLVVTLPVEVRLTRFSILIADSGLAARLVLGVTRNVIVFPLGRGPGRPGGEIELAALAESAKSYAERFEAGESLEGYPHWQHEQPSARRHFHVLVLADGEAERECRELHELPAGDQLADLRAEDGHVPDYNRAEADRRLSAARFLATGDANDCPSC